ncbi:hypothetical protein NQ317_008194 [Molorchus minor]|uniref:Uncharacterized protein n=1 Tax=Molorchus minor TaxID=1323400 RepID=A0ABQ9J6F3_9CUCU|nr:hypothetical protein NQ317_008194 [Molorchus minor]
MVVVARNFKTTHMDLKRGRNDQLLQIEQTEPHPAPDFSRHTLVKPKIYHGREKRQISSTKEFLLYKARTTWNYPTGESKDSKYNLHTFIHSYRY